MFDVDEQILIQFIHMSAISQRGCIITSQHSLVVYKNHKSIESVKCIYLYSKS